VGEGVKSYDELVWGDEMGSNDEVVSNDKVVIQQFQGQVGPDGTRMG
jgi:hypothetical protein